jgi:hypothetical protein
VSSAEVAVHAEDVRERYASQAGETLSPSRSRNDEVVRAQWYPDHV